MRSYEVFIYMTTYDISFRGEYGRGMYVSQFFRQTVGSFVDFLYLVVLEHVVFGVYLPYLR